MADDIKRGDIEQECTQIPNGGDHSPSPTFDRSWFSRESLTLSQDFTPDAGTKALVEIDVRTPKKHEWFHIHPDVKYRVVTGLWEIKTEQGRELLIIDRSLWKKLGGEIIPATLFTAINTLDEIFIVPVKMATADGRGNKWFDSALTWAERAMGPRWIRIKANLTTGRYDIFEASEDWAPANWSGLDGFADITDLLMIAFKEKYIRDWNHIVLRKWRGEVR
jgi:hypothetical protein